MAPALSIVVACLEEELKVQAVDNERVVSCRRRECGAASEWMVWCVENSAGLLQETGGEEESRWRWESESGGGGSNLSFNR